MTGRIEKTVFISYRRTNVPWALAIYQYLTTHGYDVFFDYQSIDSGDFEQIIYENIISRAHFVILLTPSALERCINPDDWLLREIGMAIHEQRNIVPIFLEGFTFGSPAIARHLKGKLALLRRYNGLNVSADYFDEAMHRLVSKFLNVHLDAVLQPTSNEVRQAIRRQQKAANNAAKVNRNELEAQKWFEKANNYENLDDKIELYTHAIELKPDYAYAFNNRGFAKYEKGDFLAAIDDYNMAVAIDKYLGQAYNNLGLAYYACADYDSAIKNYELAIKHKVDRLHVSYLNLGATLRNVGDYEGALQAYSAAIQYNEKYASAFLGRALTYWLLQDISSALTDFGKSIQLDPRNASAFFYRGRLLYELDKFDAASSDYSKSIELDSKISNAYYNRALVFIEVLKYGEAVQDLENYLYLGGGIENDNQEEVERMIRDLIERLGN